MNKKQMIVAWCGVAAIVLLGLDVFQHPKSVSALLLLPLALLTGGLIYIFRDKKDKIEKSAQGQKPEICELAILSLLLSVAGIFCAFATAPVAFVLGLIGIYQIHKGKGKVKGLSIAVLAIVIAQAGTTWLYFVGIPRIRSVSALMVCGSNLSALGRAMHMYARDNDGKYPTPSRWSDLLIEHTNVSEKQFRCLGDKITRDRCSYAMNPNSADVNSSPDMVLLFESNWYWEEIDWKVWNKVGGPELINFTNHEGYGCRILFKDGSVTFIRPTQLEELKWKDEQKE